LSVGLARQQGIVASNHHPMCRLSQVWPRGVAGNSLNQPHHQVLPGGRHNRPPQGIHCYVRYSL